MSHILKTDSVDRQKLVAFLQSPVLPRCPFVKDLFDVDGQVAMNTPLPPDYADPQSMGATVKTDNFHSVRVGEE